MRITLLALIIIVFASCQKDEDGIDEELKFTINTAYHSKGLSYYQFPRSTAFDQIPQDPKNPIDAEKVNLGQLLFHETAFATGGNFEDLRQTFSCASCHHAAAGFQAGMAQGIGDGGIGFGMRGESRRPQHLIETSDIDVQPLRSPSILNIAYQTNVLWNGQFGATAVNENTAAIWPVDGPISTNRLGYEGTETQAIAGLTVHRMKYDLEAIEANGYKAYFDQVFGDWSEDKRYSTETAGLAIAAYERTVLANEAPFQKWLRGDEFAMTDQQKRGANLFFGKGQCNSCHNGPNLASMEFHALGMSDFNTADVLNFKTDDPSKMGRASFTKNAEDNYKFKVPQLYNLKNSPFYGHGASFQSVIDVINYKNQGVAQNGEVPKSQLSDKFKPLNLSADEVQDLAIFIEEGLYDPNLFRYVPESTLSGMCYPNNDRMSKIDLGCD